jgi:hypothetical protein
MPRFLVLVAIIAGLVGAIGTGVALGDRELFVSPPEAVAETFARHLAARRYDRARALVDSARASHTTLEQLRGFARKLDERTGSIVNIDGQRGAIDGDRAAATARVVGDRAAINVGLWLSWEAGRWRISSWEF